MSASRAVKSLVRLSTELTNQAVLTLYMKLHLSIYQQYAVQYKPRDYT